MKIFLICPVRNVTEEYRDGINSVVEQLEAEGNEVYYPVRDTNQVDSIGLRICKDNRKAIEESDIVYIAWDNKSTGSLFDLGMAFAMRKPIRTVIGYFPRMTRSKSFQNMVYAWEEDEI